MTSLIEEGGKDEEYEDQEDDTGEEISEEKRSAAKTIATKIGSAEAADAEALAGLTDDEKKLLDYLDEVNGQDAYSNESAAIGKLRKEEYLVLPEGFVQPTVDSGEVGSADLHMRFSKRQLAAIYVLNKAACPKDEDAVRFGLLRMEAVKIGWFADQKEVRFAPAPADAMKTFVKDLATQQASIELYRTAAFVIPLAAEHTFRTMGHHYLTGEAAGFDARYAATFRACLHPEIGRLFRGSVLYHTLFHWVGPARAREVLRNPDQVSRIPEALMLRASAAPAGTAIVTTTAAVIKAMSVSGLSTLIAEEGRFDLRTITQMTALIKVDPARWHKTYYAYGLSKLVDDDIARLELAKAEAAKFAPIAQAFIDAMFRDSALGKAKALKKHADENPILRQKAERFFRKLGRKEATTVVELFSNIAND